MNASHLRSHFKLTIGYLCIAFLVVGGSFILHSRYSVNKELIDWTGRERVEVVLGDSGFDPKSITISLGTSVTFRAAVDRPFWPASDVHPSHTVYPEFDPQRPLTAKEEWSYVFDKEGEWQYHDHLRATHVGRIVVGSHNTARGTAESTAEFCRGAKGYQAKLGCFSSRVKKILDERGLDAAFDEVMVLYKHNPETTISCHLFAHDLGVLAYEKYRDRVPLSTKVGYCNDGFFHGYMEGFFTETKNTTKARAFCDAVATRFGSAYPNAGPQCDHGIGHGITEYILHTQPELWRDIAEVAKQALVVCEAEVTEESLRRCASGVYSVIGDWLNFKSGYGALFTKQDPFALCRYAEEDWAQLGCAWEFSKRIRSFFAHEESSLRTAHSLRLAVDAGADFSGGRYLEDIVTSLSHSSAYQYVLREPEFFVQLCRSASSLSNLQEACIIGMMNGLLAGGRPENGPERAARLCASDHISQRERAACVESLTLNIQHSYNPLGMREVCRSFPQLAQATLAPWKTCS